MISMSRFVVVFGRKQSDAAVLQRLTASRQGKDAAGVKEFELGSTPPFRLGTDDDLRFPPSFLADLPDTAGKLARLKADVSRDFDMFAKNPRRLLDLYFDFIMARLDEETAELERRLQSLGGLFRVEDWAFSALRPMPNAAIFDADDPEAASAIAIHDMAFWTGRAVLAIRLRGSGTPSPRETEACKRLLATGVRIVTIPVQELAAGIGIFSQSRFPAEFLSFWQGAPYPCSPFRPQGLTRSLSLD
jgi:hypothetical protein